MVAPAVRQKLAKGAFFEGSVILVSLHIFEPDMGQIIFKGIAHSAWQTAAGVNIAVGQYGQIAVAAVTAAIDDIWLRFWQKRLPLFDCEDIPHILYDFG